MTIRKENPMTIRASFTLALFFASMLMLTSCNSSSTDYGSNSNNGGGGGNGGGGSGTTVSVTLTDFHISMPSSLTAGTKTFSVRNAGNTIHNLEIQGNGIDQKLSSDLSPGASGSMQLTLTQGTYRAFCPVDSHAGLGMSMQLTVTP